MCANSNITLPRERVLSALKHQQTDICPYYVWMDDSIKRILAEHYNNPDFTKDYLINHTAFFEIIYGKKKALSNGTFMDGYGAVWMQGEKILHLAQPALTEPDLKNYTMPEIHVEDFYDEISQCSKRTRQSLKSYNWGCFSLNVLGR